MKKNQKVMLLAFAAAMGVGAVSTLALREGGRTFDVIANDNADSVVWKHYAAVTPTYTSHGSKEFWASCAELGTHVFEAPTKGKIEEGGDFSKTAYFTELAETDDRYIAKLTPKVSFDSCGGSEVEAIEVAYGQSATAPSDPTRDGDDYHDSYTFDGWYKNAKKYDFKTAVTGDVDLTAKWKYGNKKYEQVTLSKDNLTFNEFIENLPTDSWRFYTVRQMDAAFGDMVNNDATKKAALIEAFGESRANDGVFVSPTRATIGASNGDELVTQSVYLPKINFKELLAGGAIMTMEMGGYEDHAGITFEETEIFFRKGTADVAYLDSAKIYFYLDGETVKARAVCMKNPTTTDVYNCNEYTIELSEEKANGTESIEIGLYTNTYNRHYFFGHPRIVKGEYNYKDLSHKENVTVTNGTLATMEEANANTTACPWGNWKETTALSFDGIGVFGGESGCSSLSINYGKIDFNSLFAEGKGLRFTIGSFNNGNWDKLKFGQNEFDCSEAKPQFVSQYTSEIIAGTWANYQIEITKAGMRVLNYYKNTEYIVPLSEDQLSGKADLKFDYNISSYARFFYLSNLKAFHA